MVEIMKNGERFTNYFFDSRNDPVLNPSGHNVHYPGMAQVIHKFFGGKQLLEGGCGMGWITKILQEEYSENAEGFDFSQYAADNAVCKGIFQGDFLDTVNWDKKWEVFFVSNAIEYLEEDEVPVAMKGFKNIFIDRFFCLIQTYMPAYIRAARMPEFKGDVSSIMHAAGQNRRTFQTHDWWYEKMLESGMEMDWNLYQKIKYDNEGLPSMDFRGTGFGWKGLDIMFVLKHSRGLNYGGKDEI